MMIEDKLTQRQRLRAEALAFALELNKNNPMSDRTAQKITIDARTFFDFMTG